MKYIKILTAIITISLSSCSGFLDVEPKDSLAPEQYYNTEAELQTALTGVYSTFIKGGTFLNNLGRVGLDADEVYNYRDQNDVADYATSPNDTKILNFWRDYYAGIERANKLLANIDRAISVAQTKRDIIKGETLFLRAYFYFQLVSNFGGVPLILKSIENSDIEGLQVPRTDAKIVYQQIVADMTTASELVQDITTVGNGGRVNKSAVYGMLARVCLYMAGNPLNDKTQYQEARKWAKKVMEVSVHTLNPSYQQVFVNYATDKYEIGESIFELEFFGNGIGIYANLGGFVGSANGIQNSNDTDIGQAFAYLQTTTYVNKAFESGDLRRDWAIAPFTYSNGNPALETIVPAGYHFNKFIGKFRRVSEILKPKHASRTPQNYPIIRFSDVLLMFAEAENEINDGPTQDAYDAINRVRRRGYGFNQLTPNAICDLNGLDHNTFLEQVQLERTRELAFENMRKADLVRWGILTKKMKESLADSKVTPAYSSIVRAQAYFTNASDRDVIWPIPSYEIGVNPKLIQNPGY